MQSRHPGRSTPAAASAHLARTLPPGGACGFTLVELLVSVAIVGLLLALLLPLLSHARTSSQTVSCLSNLRQVMFAFQLYASDNHQQLPAPAVARVSWENHLRPYLSSRETFHCLADGNLFDNFLSSYDWRDTADPRTTLAGKAMYDIRRPETVFVFDALPDWHGANRINAALADGSAQTLKYEQCLKDLETPIAP